MRLFGQTMPEVISWRKKAWPGRTDPHAAPQRRALGPPHPGKGQARQREGEAHHPRHRRPGYESLSRIEGRRLRGRYQPGIKYRPALFGAGRYFCESELIICFPCSFSSSGGSAPTSLRTRYPTAPPPGSGLPGRSPAGIPAICPGTPASAGQVSARRSPPR